MVILTDIDIVLYAFIAIFGAGSTFLALIEGFTDEPSRSGVCATLSFGGMVFWWYLSILHVRFFYDSDLIIVSYLWYAMASVSLVLTFGLVLYTMKNIASPQPKQRLDELESL